MCVLHHNQRVANTKAALPNNIYNLAEFDTQDSRDLYPLG